MTDERNQLTDPEVLAACNRMLELVRSMPRDRDHHKVQMAMGALIGCVEKPDLACSAFARAASMLVSAAGQVVDVHVRGATETFVFEGNSGMIRRFEVDDGETIEVGGDVPTMQ